MHANKSGSPAKVGGREASVPVCGFKACEFAMHNLAIKPRVSTAIAINSQLCPSCSQKLSELLTTVGLRK